MGVDGCCVDVDVDEDLSLPVRQCVGACSFVRARRCYFFFCFCMRVNERIRVWYSHVKIISE